jgi:hypothetical protein
MMCLKIPLLLAQRVHLFTEVLDRFQAQPA